MLAKLLVREDAPLSAKAKELRLLSQTDVNTLDDSQRRYDGPVESTSPVKDHCVTSAKISEVRSGHVDLPNSVTMRLLLNEVRRGLGSQDGVGEELRMVLRVNGNEEASRGSADERKSEPRVGRVKPGDHVSNVDLFVAVGVPLLAVVYEAEVFKQADQSFLND